MRRQDKKKNKQIKKRTKKSKKYSHIKLLQSIIILKIPKKIPLNPKKKSFLKSYTCLFNNSLQKKVLIFTSLI